MNENKNIISIVKSVFSGLLLILIELFCTRCSTPHYKVQGVSRSHQPYKVRGKWYKPQKHYHYNETGLASWYGPMFHGEAKAHGEIYNQYAMTAAHRTLPIPSIAKVTNLENGKSVIVLVDDRGPFTYKGRIIDLSATAAKEIGMHAKGLSKVKVQTLPKESHAFSMYLKNNCGKFGKKTNGQTWEALYRKNIGCRPGYHNLSSISHKVHLLNCLEQKQQTTRKKAGLYPSSNNKKAQTVRSTKSTKSTTTTTTKSTVQSYLRSLSPAKRSTNTLSSRKRVQNSRISKKTQT